jgi:hypothetical protein
MIRIVLTERRRSASSGEFQPLQRLSFRVRTS